MSHPFNNREFTFTQPDGTEFKVRGWGDQYRARFKALDGRTISRNRESGFFEFSQDGASAEALESVPPLDLALQPVSRNRLGRNTRWRQRRQEALEQEKLEAEGPPQRQTIGTFVGLCLPIRFRDISTKITRKEIDDFCNKPSYAGYKNNGSVRDFFLDNSNGKCDYMTSVAPLYTAKKDRAYYVDTTQDYGVRAEELITEALSFHKESGFDFSGLTTDAKNYLYAVNAFYAGDVVNNWSEGLWPHAHYLSKPVKLGTGVAAHDYQITALGKELEIGTYCHENGHMLCDFPDLYDYDSDSAGIGEYCLMCGGNGADPRNPVQVAGYLKFCAGWAGKVTKAELGIDVSLPAKGNHFLVHRKSATEYLLIENRAKTSRDAALPDQGIAIWHVDEKGDNRHQQGHPEAHYECALIQADGLKDLENNKNQGGPGDLFSGSAMFLGKWWDGTPVGLSFECTGKPGPTMTVKVRKA